MPLHGGSPPYPDVGCLVANEDLLLTAALSKGWEIRRFRIAPAGDDTPLRALAAGAGDAPPVAHKDDVVAGSEAAREVEGVVKNGRRLAGLLGKHALLLWGGMYSKRVVAISERGVVGLVRHVVAAPCGGGLLVARRRAIYVSDLLAVPGGALLWPAALLVPRPDAPGGIAARGAHIALPPRSALPGAVGHDVGLVRVASVAPLPGASPADAAGDAFPVAVVVTFGDVYCVVLTEVVVEEESR